jgi:hypothetical protein
MFFIPFAAFLQGCLLMPSVVASRSMIPDKNFLALSKRTPDRRSEAKIQPSGLFGEAHGSPVSLNKIPGNIG